MNAKEELTKLLMESYDKGVEDAKQAAIEGIQKAILLEREASLDAVLQVIKELRPALVLAAFADKDNAWVLDKVKESVEKLKETK